MAQNTASALFTDLGLSHHPNNLIGAVKQGVATKALAGSLDVSEAFKVTGLSVPSLVRRKRGGRLSQNESEHVLIATLFAKAVNVFGAAGAARGSFKTPYLGLGDAPLAYADAENRLGCTAFGVYDSLAAGRPLGTQAFSGGARLFGGRRNAAGARSCRSSAASLKPRPFSAEAP